MDRTLRSQFTRNDSSGKSAPLHYFRSGSKMDWTGAGRKQNDSHRSRLLRLAPGWQNQACFIPVKENWISRSRSETFPEAGLNLQIVQNHFPSD